MATHDRFAITLMLEGKKDMETIPPKKTRTQTYLCKTSCSATDVIKALIEHVIVLIFMMVELTKMPEKTWIFVGIPNTLKNA